MKIPSPAAVAVARTARLAAEASKPAYSTSTPDKVEREHITQVEVENDYHRFWAGTFYSAKQESKGIERYKSLGYSISDIDCSVKCWCVKEK